MHLPEPHHTPREPWHPSRPMRWLLAVVSVVFLILGIIGVILPAVPATVFWIISAWAGAKSCPAIQRWIYRRGRMGRSIEQLLEEGTMTHRSRKWSLIGVIVGVSFSILGLILTNAPWWLPVLVGLGGLSAILWIVWRYPIAEPQRPPLHGDSVPAA